MSDNRYRNPANGWLREAMTKPPQPIRQDDLWKRIGAHEDAQAAVIEWSRENHSRPFQGIRMDNHQPVLGDFQSFLLNLAASGMGKTSRSMIVNGLTAPGPLVYIGPRRDAADALAAWRGRMGDVWNACTASEPMPGALAARYSPIQGCEDTDFVSETANRISRYGNLSEAARHNEHGANPFFKDTGAMALECVLHDAALRKSWSVPLAYLPLASKDYKALGEVAERLITSRDVITKMRGAELKGIISAYGGEKSGDISSAAAGLKPWTTRKALATTVNPNFDFDRFVRVRADEPTRLRLTDSKTGLNHPVMGACDTLLVFDANSDNPSLTVVVEKLVRVINACKRYADECDRLGLPPPLPVTILIDDLYRVHIPMLMGLLSDARDRAMILIGAIQDESLAQDAHSGALGRGYFSMWRSVLIHPGIKHPETVEALSKLSKRDWVEIASGSESRDPKGRIDWMASYGYQQLPALSPDEIGSPHPTCPSARLWMNERNEFTWIDTAGYFENPWAQILVNAMEHAVVEGTQLPLPPLTKHGFRHLEALGIADRWRRVERRHKS
jgi:hypothetical protein